MGSVLKYTEMPLPGKVESLSDDELLVGSVELTEKAPPEHCDGAVGLGHSSSQ